MSADYPAGPEEVAQLLLNCLLDKFRGRPALERAYIATGFVAVDSPCGQLTVIVDRVWRSLNARDEALGVDACQVASIMIDFDVLLVRCVPTGDDRGNPPTPRELTDAYQAILEEQTIVYRCFTDGDLPGELWDVASISQDSSGANGGAVAVDTHVTIALNVTEWCG